MTRIERSAGEHRLVRVFSIAAEGADAKAFEDQPERLATALGVDQLDFGKVAVFDVKTLEDYPLADYLAEGQGIADTALRAEAGLLNALTGHVAIVPTSALAKGADLTVQATLRLVGTYAEDRPPASFAPLPDAAATGTVAPPAPQKPVRGPGMILLALLAIPVALFLILFAVKT